MSGPVTEADAPPDDSADEHPERVLELLDARESRVGSMRVRRALPRRAHRTVGAWCFADHMGPAAVTEHEGVDIGPHPHIGLQTVTWLTAGEILHRDSLGSEQVIRPGQLNLMTAGRGVSHSEEATGTYRGDLHGIQLWIAQPEATRHGDPAFEHHVALPRIELDRCTATVVVGALAGVTSPARRDTELVGAELDLRAGDTTVPLRTDHEHALLVLAGSVEVEGEQLEPGRLAYLGTGRDEIGLRADDPVTAMVLGGEPLGEEILMWWNFVARTRDEVDAALGSWDAGDGRFGRVESPLDPIPAPARPWAG
jgi:quercetin 2,3-dioxygenase